LVIIFDPKFIIIDNACQYSIDSKIIWRCDRFLDLINKPSEILDEHEYVPRIEENLVYLLGWEFDISSTVYKNGKPNEIPEGWKLINVDLKANLVDRLVQPYFLRTVLSADGQSLDHIRN